MSERILSGRLYGAGGEAELRASFTRGDIPVAVYGLGKMGLPLAATYADITGNVTGVDIDSTVVDSVNRGRCHVKREPGLPELVESVVGSGGLTATAAATEAAADARLHVVIVPTLLNEDRTPDLSIVRAVTESIAEGLGRGDLVVYESTLPPGTCADVLAPLLARASGLAPGEFGVAFCPERAMSGQVLDTIQRSRAKVVGGVDDESTRVASVLYDELVDNDVVVVSDATTAEATKVFEGLYRDTNIALANQLAKLTDELGIDVREAIGAANTQPYCDILRPGAGVGGHCIPYYPYFVLNWLATEAPLVSMARSVNDDMPSFVVEKVVEGLERAGVDPAASTVLVLGLTYRPGVVEVRASPAIGICSGLRERGADVFAVDPLVDDGAVFDATLVPLELIDSRSYDAAVLVTAQPEFDAIDWSAFEPMTIVDTRDALSQVDSHHRIYTVGRGYR